MPSNAPALTSASITLRFTLRPSTRLQKSNSDRNGPPCSRAALMTSTAPSPTPFTAPSPNRITFFCFVPFSPLASTTLKSVSGFVDVGAEDGDAVALGLGDELHHRVGVVLVAGEQRREELDRVVALQVGGLVGEQAVRGGVAAVEAVAGELLHQVEDALGDLGVDLLLLGAVEEAGLLLGHDLRLLLAHGAAKEVGLAQAVAGQRRRRSA